jgi:hypothetical protein
VSLRSRVFLFIVFAYVGARTADAQILQRPERASQPPARAQQEFKLTLSSLGGYDDNLSPNESSGLDAFTPREAGYTGFADAALQYFRGHDRVAVDLGGRAFLNSFRNVGLTPSYGGELRARTVVTVGRRHQLQVDASARSDPFYALGAFGSLRTDVGTSILPDSNPLNGSYVRRSFGADGGVALVNRWSTRNTFTTSYRYNQREFDDHIGDGMSHGGQLEYFRGIGRRSAVRASYRRIDSEFTDADGSVRPFIENAAELGYQHQRNYTRTRTWVFGFGAGATHVSTIRMYSREPLQYSLPSAYGRLQIDLGRTWNVSGDYRRALAVLEGLTVESFITNAAILRLGGNLGSRTDVTVLASYVTGAATATDAAAHVESYSATAQFKFQLTSLWSVVVAHTFYSYNLSGVEDVPAGFAQSLDRNALRVGMTLELPMIRAGRAGRKPSAGRN